jgi:hypothetical protein
MVTEHQQGRAGLADEARWRRWQVALGLDISSSQPGGREHRLSLPEILCPAEGPVGIPIKAGEKRDG